MDFVSIGETMLRLVAPDGRSLEAATSFDIEVAGAESNVATALARLGYRSGWVSVLPGNDLGRMVAAAICRHGVDTSRVTWRSDRARLGIYYWEPGVAPRQGRVIYDRLDSAFSSITRSDVDWAYVRSARYVLVTGISAAISAGSLETIAEAIACGKAAGRTVVFDMNYRSSMWTTTAAHDTVAPLLRNIDIFFCPSRDAKAVFGIDAKPAEQARQLSENYGPPVVVLTCGPEGAVAWDGAAHAAAARSAAELDTLGRGDALVAGFLHGLERTSQIGEAVEYGVALAALKQTYRGDIAWVRSDDLDDLVGGDASPLSRKIKR